MAPRQSPYHYGPTGLPGLTLPDASLTHDTAAPPGFLQGKQPSHGNQDLDDQMYFDSIGNFQLQGSSSQGYNTDLDLLSPQHRDEEGDTLTLGPNPLPQYQDGTTNDNITDHVSGYHPVLTPPWNPVIAAQATGGASQQKQMNPAFLTTPDKQRTQPFSESGYVSGSVRSGRSGSFGQRPLDLQATPRSIPPLQQLSLLDRSYSADMDFNSGQGHPNSVSEAGSATGSINCPWPECPWTGKTRSDLKKHAARHNLDHVCDRGECARSNKGFATINDLQRHQRTVHKIFSKDDRLYKCFAKNCGHPDKQWPRKDNFRSHLKKLHANEDADDLLKRSEAWWNAEQRHESHADQSPYGVQTPSPISHTGRHHNAATQFSSSPSSSNPQPSQGSRITSQIQTHPFMLDDGSIDNLMPGTTSYEDQSQNNRRLRNFAASGYSSHHPHQHTHHPSRPVSQSGQFHPNPINNNSRMFRTQGQLNDPSGYQSGQARSNSQHSPQSVPQISFSQGANASSNMNRSFSGGAYDGITHTQYQHTVHHPGTRTVADPLLSLEPERLSMNQQPSLQSPIGFDEQNQPNAGDFFGIASHWSTEMSELNTNTIPTIVVHPDTEKGGGSASSGQDFENVRQFLNNYKRQLEDKGGDVAQFQNLLETMSKSVSGTTTADSSDILPSSDVPADSYIQENRDSTGKGLFRCGYPTCTNSKLWERRSEIKKHIKRHTKPYGCTFDLCYKKFGAKSDWIRHETKKHLQQEVWLCEFKHPDMQPCRTLHAKRDRFYRHLQEHGIASPGELNRQMVEQHINANFQPQYWCGFCEQITALKHKGKAGIHERYDHITVHLINEDRCIDDWVPADSTKSKGQIRDAKKRPNSDDSEEAEDGDADSPSSDVASTAPRSQAQMMNRPRRQSQPHPHQHRHQQHQQARNRANLGPGSMQPILGRRTATDAGFTDFDASTGPPPSTQAEQILNQAQYWRCCQCNEHNLYATSPACSGNSVCSHVRCQSCSYFRRRVSEEIGG